MTRLLATTDPRRKGTTRKAKCRENRPVSDSRALSKTCQLPRGLLGVLPPAPEGTPPPAPGLIVYVGAGSIRAGVHNRQLRFLREGGGGGGSPLSTRSLTRERPRVRAEQQEKEDPRRRAEAPKGLCYSRCAGSGRVLCVVVHCVFVPAVGKLASQLRAPCVLRMWAQRGTPNPWQGKAKERLRERVIDDRTI